MPNINTAAIQTLEELSLTAWPSLQTSYYDGWVLRFSNGYTRRANSVNPLYPSALDLNQKIETCESLYRERGLPAVFKMTAGAHPADLDAALAARGYEAQAFTSVQTLDLNGLDAPDYEQARLSAVVEDDWLDVFSRMNNVPPEHVPTMRDMLRRAVPPVVCLSLYRDGRTAAVGGGAVERGYIGVFDIVTDSAFRGQGLGRQVMLHLLAWGKARGATQAYLQVMLNNIPALRLYGGLGFREVYQYWYRVKAG